MPDPDDDPSADSAGDPTTESARRPASDAEVLLRLPDALRGAFKDPFGPVYTDAAALLAEAGDPIIAVGDVVSAHLTRAGHAPDVAVVDGITEREPVDEAVAADIDRGGRVETVANPAATLTADLIGALAVAIAAGERVVIDVDGEEDLATLPAIAAAPDGASVVYGQPGEGMVLVSVDEVTRERVRALMARMDGDIDAVWALFG